MKFSRQTTLRSQATVTGVGVHSGLPVNLTIGPASVDAGFIFVRSGLAGGDREVQATADAVIATELATVLGDAEGPLVSTAEHVLAAGEQQWRAAAARDALLSSRGVPCLRAAVAWDTPSRHSNRASCSPPSIGPARPMEPTGPIRRTGHPTPCCRGRAMT